MKEVAYQLVFTFLLFLIFQPDDLYGLLQNQLPTGNFSIMVDSKKEFMKKLAEQKNFAPFGTKIASFAG